MSKPEDIPQDVWTRALAASVLIFDRLLDEGRIAVISIEARDQAAVPIARAIMAAKAEEREACAAIADDWVGGAEYIANAIRKRAELQ